MKLRKLTALVVALALTLFTMIPAFAEEAAPQGPLYGKLIILHTNDVHGHAISDAEHFGYPRIAQLKINLQKLGASVLLLDAGDAMQGTPLVNLSKGNTAIEFMNAAGYDAMCIGNHEFDWGSDNLFQVCEAAEFPVLACNITDPISGELKFKANTIFDMPNGLKVGVFGLSTPETMTKAHPDKVKGITFSAGEKLYEDARKQVEELTEAGCDIIVALGHLGDADESAPNRSIDVMNEVEGIDIFIDGHSHTMIEGGEIVNDVMHVSTGEHGRNIGYVIVDKKEDKEESYFEITAGLYTAEEDELESLMATGAQLTAEPMVEDIVNTANEKVEKELSAVFAKTEVDLNGERDPGVRTMETNLGDFSCDALLWAAKQAMGDDKVVAALTNGGGIRASIPAGDITMRDMKTVFPFGNELTVITVTGAELLEALEAATFSTPGAIGAFPQVAGIEYEIDTAVPFESSEKYPDSTYDKPAKPGSRVTINSIGGEAFDPEKLYTIVTNDFVAAGGDTYYVFRYPYKNSGHNTRIALEDALVQYTQEVLGGVIGKDYAEPQGRIIIK